MVLEEMSRSSSCSSNSISVVNSIVGIREAFQTKKRGHLGNSPNRGVGGGSSKNLKKSQVSVGKS